MTLSVYYSLFYFIVSTAFLLLGLYTLFLNSKGALNRVFSFICLTLFVWSLTFSISNFVVDYESALLWRRWSTLGWGCLFSLILHFLLILTKPNFLLHKKWLYGLLYLPCLPIIYIYGWDSNLAQAQFALIKTGFGWVSVYSSSLWNISLVVYYFIFSAAGLWLLWQWHKKSPVQVKKKLVWLLISTYILTLIMGTFTDFIINSRSSNFVPQLASIFSLLPLALIFFAIKRYGFITQTKTQPTEPGKILSPDKIIKFNQIITLVFIVTGIANFASQYFFDQASFSQALLHSGSLIGLGVLLQCSQQLSIKKSVKDTFLFIVLAVSIPLITLQNIQGTSITMWAVPIIFIMLSVVYNKKRIMIWLGSSIIFTQIWVWLKVQTSTITVTAADHLGRLLIYLIILGMAFYVNRIYIQRLEENENQIHFQKMVSRLSTAFLGITYANREDSVNDLFKISADYFQMDRAYLIGLEPVMKNYEWCKAGFKDYPNHIILNEQDFTWLMDLPWQDDIIHLSDGELLANESLIQAKLNNYQIKSLLAVKVKNQAKTVGIMLYTATSKQNWRDEHIEMLRIIANFVNDSLIKMETDRKINRLAYYDSLTGLPNRTLFINRLEQSIHLAKRSAKLIGIVFIDLDCFKAINDSIGHEGGDQVLKQVASRLTGCLRKHDTVTRFGGDEFLIQITQINRVEDLHKIAENIIQVIAQPVEINEQQFYLTASAGVSVYPMDGEEAEPLIKNADLAMYSSKKSGKNQYTFCSADLKKDAQKELILTNHLYRALDRKEMVLEYQPQLSILTKQFSGVEALIRWQHPDWGTILPNQFIPLAEKTGLIHPIGEWVLATACRQNKQWQASGLSPLLMTVNISLEQLRKPNLVDMVARILDETGMEARYLGMDINECVIQESDSVLQVLYDLKNLGVSLALEGFGNEYSSLGCLHVLPIDQVKINMQFVQAISQGKKEADIAKTIIQLAQNLHFNVVAEGVETDSQFSFFCQHQCDEIQGFNVVKPMPAKNLEAILISRAIQSKHPGINLKIDTSIR